MTSPQPTQIALNGLSLGTSQVWGSVRLVPLTRDQPIEDLRLSEQCWGGPTAVSLPDNTSYFAFIPHAFVASWSHDDTPVASLGTQPANAAKSKSQHFQVRFAHRMAKRERQRGVAVPRLRFLPLHTAFEAYLALHFAGPNVLRREYSQRVLSQGLSPRVEMVTPGAWLPGLEEALRVFEIRDGQVGMLLFVADVFAGAFVLPHPEDYRRLHRTLLSDCYGELVFRYACLSTQAAALVRPLRDKNINSFEDLRVELARARADWTSSHHSMASGLFEQDVHVQHVYRLGKSYRLERFLPDFRLRQENHIGEQITGRDGETAYLKTFRLSEAQVRRGYLLSTLARHDWDLYASAAALNTDKLELCSRLERAGFGDMLRAHLRRRDGH
ncbi:hypothetical protein DB30_00264 [Enhygromyxa salina]|uniref:ARG and Rhodanese-Phosphatase-superfamily-associated domain-containing protein n=1 Tax=Enhygromyxa salina TaxID=215803 RepID=A0A0C1ZM66_9BACT|nr:hypothetical protein [Enhygromyxa salina]KIG18579.1 hypothetical protein DB30_00264 [Enhygromyxa salina]